jgi:hypothetical protein
MKVWESPGYFFGPQPEPDGQDRQKQENADSYPLDGMTDLGIRTVCHRECQSDLHFIRMPAIGLPQKCLFYPVIKMHKLQQ